jgi:hypothetical protein
MRLSQWWLLGAVALAPFVPTQHAHATTIVGTASFSDTGPSGNGLNFTGVFNPSNVLNLNLTEGSPLTLTNFLTITAVDSNWNFLSTATDTITTAFNFTSPPGSGSVSGIGTDTSLFFVFDQGNIHWNAPATVNFDNGLALSIALSDASFFGVLGGILPYPSVGIDATFSLTGTGTTVSQAPLPAALPLFATGLGAIGLLGWWRRKRQRTLAGATG